MSRIGILFVGLLSLGTACGETVVPECTDECEPIEEKLTLELDGFYDAGGTWLTATSGPLLTGTVAEAGSPTIYAFVGDVQVGPVATQASGGWSLQLPEGTISEEGTEVTLKLFTTAGEQRLSQKLTYDKMAPTATAVATSMLDERGDTVDFATGEPVHTHAGPAIELGPTGCARVYKYGYLLDAQPQFASENAKNPIRLAFRTSSLVETQFLYRVQKAGTTVLDWTPGPAAGADGTRAIEIQRDAIPGLGTGDYTLEVKSVDWTGREATASSCWSLVTLAAPLELAPITLRASDPKAIAAWTLRTDSPISKMLTSLTAPDAMPRVFHTKIQQHAAEPVTLHVRLDAPAIGASRSSQSYHIGEISPFTQDVPCGSTGAPSRAEACLMTAPTDTSNNYQGVILGARWNLSLLDEATNTALPCDRPNGLEITCTIPARQESEAPHPYSIVASVDGLAALAPPGGTGALGEYAFHGTTYTGYAPEPHQRCQTMSTGQLDNSLHCTRAITYYKLDAIASAAANFDRPSLALEAGRVDEAVAPLPYVTGSKLDGPVLSWNSGSDSLPR